MPRQPHTQLNTIYAIIYNFSFLYTFLISIGHCEGVHWTLADSLQGGLKSLFQTSNRHLWGFACANKSKKPNRTASYSPLPEEEGPGEGINPIALPTC